MGKNDISKEDLMGLDYRKQYLEHYILQRYKNEIERNKLGMCEFYYSYISFIIFGLSNETKSFREILKLRFSSYQKADFGQKQMIFYFLNEASSEFDLSTKEILYAKHERIIDLINYDEVLENCIIQYNECLNQKYQLLRIISKDFIDLNQLQKQAQQLQKIRNQLQKDLIKLFHQNSSCVFLQKMCQGFEECLNIEPIFSKMYKNLNPYKLKKIQTLYTRDAAAVYVSMLSEVGNIVKVSKNFKDIVPLVEKNSDAIGRSINFILPNEIAQVHNQMLLDSLEKKKLNQNINHQNIMLVKDSDGWAIPFNIKLQICMIKDTELGACGWMQQVKDENIYLQTLSLKDNLKIIIQDQQFYMTVFQDIISHSNSKKINLINIISMIKTIIQKGNPGQSYETIMIQPSSLQEAMEEKDINDKNVFNSLFDKSLFSIRFDFYTLDNPRIQYVIFKITQLKYLDDKYLKKEALRNLKFQMCIFNENQQKINNLMNQFNVNSYNYQISNLSPNNSFIQHQDAKSSMGQIQNSHLEDVQNEIDDNVSQKNTQKQRHLQRIDKKNSIQYQRTLSKDLQDSKKEQMSQYSQVSKKHEQNNNSQIDFIENMLYEKHISNKDLLQSPIISELIKNISNSPAKAKNKKNSLTKSDYLNQFSQIDLNNILSSDTLYLTPRSSFRNSLLAPETNRLVQKGDICQFPIIERQVEEDEAKSSQLIPFQQQNINFNVKRRDQSSSAIENILGSESNGISLKNKQSMSNTQDVSKSKDIKTQNQENLFKMKQNDESQKTTKSHQYQEKQISNIYNKNNKSLNSN